VHVQNETRAECERRAGFEFYASRPEFKG